MFYSRFLTAKQVQELDRSIIMKALNGLRAFGVTESNVEEYREGLTRQFGSPPAAGDLVWRMYNATSIKISDKITNGNDLRKLASIKRMMAEFLESEGRDGTSCQKDAERLEALAQQHNA